MTTILDVISGFSDKCNNFKFLVENTANTHNP